LAKPAFWTALRNDRWIDCFSDPESRRDGPEALPDDREIVHAQ